MGNTVAFDIRSHYKHKTYDICEKFINFKFCILLLAKDRGKGCKIDKILGTLDC